MTAGDSLSFNTMTASWGGFTYVWGRPATITYIRDSRYTYEFMQREEGFTLCFFAERYRAALRLCGTTSGRDTDKVLEAGLTPIMTPSGLPAFAEARMIIECRKMLVQELDCSKLTEAYKDEIMKSSYTRKRPGISCSCPKSRASGWRDKAGVLRNVVLMPDLDALVTGCPSRLL